MKGRKMACIDLRFCRVCSIPNNYHKTPTVSFGKKAVCPLPRGFPAFHTAPLRLLPCLLNCLPEGIGGEDITPFSRQEEWSCPCGTHSLKKNPLIFLLHKQKGCGWLLFLHVSTVVCNFAHGRKVDGMLPECFWKGAHNAGKSRVSQWWWEAK